MKNLSRMQTKSIMFILLLCFFFNLNVNHISPFNHITKYSSLINEQLFQPLEDDPPFKNEKV